MFPQCESKLETNEKSLEARKTIVKKYGSLKNARNGPRERREKALPIATRKAIRQAEYRAMREAYRKQPDPPLDADDWSTPEEFKA